MKFLTQKSIFAFVSGLILAVFLFSKRQGINPESLWLDDTWVAVLAKFATPLDLLQISNSCPLGFVYIQKVALFLFHDKEWSLQVFPLFFSVLTIFVSIALVYLLTKQPYLGLTAGIVLCASPVLNEFSVRAKQFTLDALISICLLLLVPLTLKSDNFNKKLFLIAGISGVIAIFFSHTSFFLAVPIINVLGLQHVVLTKRSQSNLDKTIVAAWIIFNALLVGIYFSYLSSRANADMLAYWKSHYLPTSSFHEFYSFFATKGLAFITLALPDSMRWFAVFLIPGFIYLLKEHRTLFWVICLFYFGIFSSSALSMFPIGSGRVDLFSHSITLLIITLGFNLTIKTLFCKNKRLYYGAMIIASLFFLFYAAGSKTVYRSVEDARYIQFVNEEVMKNDAIIAFPWANYALAYYGRWNAKIVPADYSTNGFEAQPIRPFTYILPEGFGQKRFMDDPAILQPFIDDTLDEQFERIIYVSCYSGSKKKHSNFFKSVIASRGYRAITAIDDLHNEFYVFVKESK